MVAPPLALTLQKLYLTLVQDCQKEGGRGEEEEEEKENNVGMLLVENAW